MPRPDKRLSEAQHDRLMDLCDNLPAKTSKALEDTLVEDPPVAAVPGEVITQAARRFSQILSEAFEYPESIKTSEDLRGRFAHAHRILSRVLSEFMKNGSLHDTQYVPLTQIFQAVTDRLYVGVTMGEPQQYVPDVEDTRVNAPASLRGPRTSTIAQGLHVSKFRQRKADAREISLQQVQSLQDIGPILQSISRAVTNNSLGIDAAATEFLVGNDLQGAQPNLEDVLKMFQTIVVSSLSFDGGRPITAGLIRYRLAKAKDEFKAQVRNEYPNDALNAWYHDKSEAIYTALERMFKAMCDRIENRMDRMTYQARS